MLSEIDIEALDFQGRVKSRVKVNKAQTMKQNLESHFVGLIGVAALVN
jgi:hypothetical protein